MGSIEISLIVYETPNSDTGHVMIHGTPRVVNARCDARLLNMKLLVKVRQLFEDSFIVAGFFCLLT